MLKDLFESNITVNTCFGPVKFDEDGIAQGLTIEQERHLGVVKDWEFTEPEPEKSKAPAKPKPKPQAKPKPVKEEK